MPDIELKSLPDPYASSVRKGMFRLNPYVLLDDVLTIQSVAPSRGTPQKIVANFIHAIATELRERGITFYSPENYNEFIDIVKRRTAPRPVGDARNTNVAGRKKSVRAKNTNPPPQRTNPAQSDG